MRIFASFYSKTKWSTTASVFIGDNLFPVMQLPDNVLMILQ